MKLSASDLRSMIGSARGNKSSELPYHVVRELNEADMSMLLNPGPVGSTTPLIKTLRARHHHLARILAMGEDDRSASIITGYSMSRISLMRADPAFQDLVAYYKAQADAEYVGVHEQLAQLGTEVVEELQERLETKPETFSTKDLLLLGEFALDRSVAPPKSRSDSARGVLPQINISFHKGTEQVDLLSVPVIDHQEQEE
jgi:hypothetical protein